MKIKKAIDICKKSKMIATFYVADEQWITNGEACFSVAGICNLNEEYICALYDISDKQREKIQFKIGVNAPGVVSRGDMDPAETEAQILKIGLLLYAIIAPVIINDEIVRTLENLYTAAKIANFNNSGGTT